MGFYSKYVLPRLIDLAMKNRDTARLRAEWLPRARGDVLEVGIGSGLNLPFYSQEVRRVCGVDPSVELQRIARSRLPASSFEIEFFRLPMQGWPHGKTNSIQSGKEWQASVISIERLISSSRQPSFRSQS
jgi:hypothetical protein